MIHDNHLAHLVFRCNVFDYFVGQVCGKRSAFLKNEIVWAQKLGRKRPLESLPPGTRFCTCEPTLVRTFSNKLIPNKARQLKSNTLLHD